VAHIVFLEATWTKHGGLSLRQQRAMQLMVKLFPISVAAVITLVGLVHAEDKKPKDEIAVNRSGPTVVGLANIDISAISATAKKIRKPVTRSSLLARFQNPTLLEGGMQVYQEGKVVGWRLTRMGSKGFFAALGLQKDDTLLAIDGSRFESRGKAGSPADGESFSLPIPDIQTCSSISLLVLRDGAFLNILVRVR
jgi:hypothetical protein